MQVDRVEWGGPGWFLYEKVLRRSMMIGVSVLSWWWHSPKIGTSHHHLHSGKTRNSSFTSDDIISLHADQPTIGIWKKYFILLPKARISVKMYLKIFVTTNENQRENICKYLSIEPLLSGARGVAVCRLVTAAFYICSSQCTIHTAKYNPLQPTTRK